MITGKNPSYKHIFGFWLNKNRAIYRRAYVFQLGYAVAKGNTDPGLDYFRAITDSEQQAKSLKMRTDALRND